MRKTHACMHARTHTGTHMYSVQGTVLGFEACVGQHVEERGRGPMCHHVNRWKKY